MRHEPVECTWCAATQKWSINLPHHGQWFTSRPRPCIAPLLRLSRCSQDVQWWHSRGALLRHVGGCATKYGEALTDTERHSVRRCMCRSWKAAAPQMVMALAREAMSFNSVQSKSFCPPSSETFEDVTLCLYRGRHAQGMHLNFHRWLRAYTVWWSFDEAALAATRPRRTCLPQWRCCTSTSHATNSSGSGWFLNVPHTQVAGLLSQSVMHLPENLKYFAAGCVVRQVLGK